MHPVPFGKDADLGAQIRIQQQPSAPRAGLTFEEPLKFPGRDAPVPPARIGKQGRTVTGDSPQHREVRHTLDTERHDRGHAEVRQVVNVHFDAKEPAPTPDTEVAQIGEVHAGARNALSIAGPDVGEQLIEQFLLRHRPARRPQQRRQGREAAAVVVSLAYEAAIPVVDPALEGRPRRIRVCARAGRYAGQ